MRYFIMSLFCAIVALSGCNVAPPQTNIAAQPAQSEDLVGKWHLVRAGGRPPEALNIKSLSMEIDANGAWTSEIVMQGQFAGMSMKGGGKWSIVDGVVHYTSGANSGKSQAQFESGRLILDPDFSVRKDGKQEVIGEYER